MSDPEPNFRAVIERHRSTLMRLEGVVGIAVGLSRANPRKRCIQVYVTTAEGPAGVPEQLEGCAVELVRTSGFRAT